MKEVRLSIPIIGGITVIYTHDDIQRKKQAVKRAFSTGIACTARFGSRVISSIANKIEGKTPTQVVKPVVQPSAGHVVDTCYSCGAPFVNGVCRVHGLRSTIALQQRNSC